MLTLLSTFTSPAACTAHFVTQTVTAPKTSVPMHQKTMLTPACSHFLRGALDRMPPKMDQHGTIFVRFASSPETFCLNFSFFFRICLGILHWKMAGIFGEFFLVSVSHKTKHEKSLKISGKIRREIRGKIRDKNSKNSGNFRSATFLA